MADKGLNFLTRVGTAAVLIVIVVGAVLLSPYGFLALIVAVCLGAIWEFLRMAHLRGADPVQWYTMISGATIVALIFLYTKGDIGPKFLLVPPALTIAFFIAELYRKKDTPIANISVSVGSLAYIAAPMSMLCILAWRDGEYDPWIVLSIVGIVAVNDTFAYLTGMLLGRHKLFERISPKKSWEGFAGGLVFGVGAAVLFGYLQGGDLLFWAGTGVVTVLGAVLGDLIESLFKRSAGIKDSGNILPGHGGILDRIDALLMAVPLVFIYFTIFAM